MIRIPEFIRKKYSLICLWLIVPLLLVWGLSHPRWQKPENTIAWDVKSYYAYLPATFIYKDLSLNFIRGDSVMSSIWVWPVETQTKQLALVTSMGLSFLYTPFFLAGHVVAMLSPAIEANGYTKPYSMALFLSSMFYVILALFILRKFLLRYYPEWAVLISLIAILFGTNLLFFTGPMAAMPHAYNFFLFSLFLLLNRNWHEKQSVKNTIFLGLTAGLITLVRPTNIIILLLLIFWNVYSWKSFTDKVMFFLKNYGLVLLMILSFFLVWAPQFAYWKFISGKFLYFTYGDVGGRFFWDNPQFRNILFSFRKGWFIYTPLALMAIIGIPFLIKKNKELILPIILFVLVNIYIQSSWWCWWFGGAYGLRAFVDSYAILVIPLAALLSQSLRFRWNTVIGLLLVFFLTWFNLFQIRKYNREAIHYWWMSRESFRETLFIDYTTERYHRLVPWPDYAKAKKGIYVAKNLIQRYEGELNITPKMIIEEIKIDIEPGDVNSGLKKRGEENNLSMDSLVTIQAWNIYETRRDISAYIDAAEVSMKKKEENQTDSLSLAL